MASIINATTTAGVSVQGDNSGSLQLATNNGTTAVTIDTSQNVGIGTSSPLAKLDVVSSSGTYRNRMRNSSVGESFLLFQNSASGTNDNNGLLTGIGSDGVAYLYNYQNTALLFATNGTEQARITSAGLLQFNSGYGSVATAFGCRAWVNFNGTGTVAISASGNVSSITDDAVGSYTVNLTNAMPDGNFSATLSSGTNSSGGINAYTTIISSTSAIAVYTFSVAGGGSGAYRDTASVLFAVFR